MSAKSASTAGLRPMMRHVPCTWSTSTPRRTASLMRRRTRLRVTAFPTDLATAYPTHVRPGPRTTVIAPLVTRSDPRGIPTMSERRAGGGHTALKPRCACGPSGGVPTTRRDRLVSASGVESRASCGACGCWAGRCASISSPDVGPALPARSRLVQPPTRWAKGFRTRGPTVRSTEPTDVPGAAPRAHFGSIETPQSSPAALSRAHIRRSLSARERFATVSRPWRGPHFPRGGPGRSLHATLIHTCGHSCV